MRIEQNNHMEVTHFFPLSPSTDAHTAQLTQARTPGTYIPMQALPGTSDSSIEKMTHPLATSEQGTAMSPYMLFLLADQGLLMFAERVLQTSRKRCLARLGIDDTPQQTQRATLLQTWQTVVCFYQRSQEASPRRVELNQHPFLVQPPTRAYFSGQRLITPDFTRYRQDPQYHRAQLLRCRLRDDSQICFNRQPIWQIKRYVDNVGRREHALRIKEAYANESRYFVEMMEYLTLEGQPGDILTQNPLESSSDKHTPHLQFIPGNVCFPLLLQPYDTPPVPYATLPWHLPTLLIPFPINAPDGRKRAIALQNGCLALREQDRISTLPIWRKVDETHLHLYLLFQKDDSSCWHFTPEEEQHRPGWLEACGVFIANTPRATHFTALGTAQYYASYTLPPSDIALIHQKIRALLVG